MWRSLSTKFLFSPNHHVRFQRLSTKTATKRRQLEADFKEGAEIEGFLVNQVSEIDELRTTLIRLRHVRTGCDYLHLGRDDGNDKVFAVGFRTTPLDSTGASHVCQQAVLCGSTKYPIRDPLTKMSGRSTANFVDAMTGPDYTLFAFATRYWPDYENLAAIFMDAVFRPRLREVDFLRVGWRFEHASPQNKETPVVIRGRVYNEMKNLLFDNDALFSNALLNNLLPSHTYAVNSGGDPKSIPDLTYETLKTFHKKFYHPSNCRIYSNGDVPLLKILKFLDAEYLSDFSDSSDYGKTTKVPLEVRWDSERRKHVSCRPISTSSHKKRSTIGVATLCNDVRSSDESFAMQILNELLTSGRHSPFYRSLIDSNLGRQYSPGTGYDRQTRDTFFSVGLSEVDANDFDKIVDVYRKTLDKTIVDGFEEKEIQAVLQTIELLNKHQTSNYGMNVLLRLMPTWIHDGDVTRALRIDDQLTNFKQSLDDNPSYLKDVVKEYLIDNRHRLILTMSPDDDYESSQHQREKEAINRQISALDVNQKEGIFDKSSEISRDLDTSTDCRILPLLSTSQLADDVERIVLKGYRIQKVPIQTCNCPTYGISYLRGVLNASILSEEAKSLLPLFCVAATRMGTRNRDCKIVDNLIRSKTGNLSFKPHVAENIYDNSSYEEGIVFGSMCLDRNVDSMMEIWSDVFTGLRFDDVDRFRSVVRETALSTSFNFADSADLYAISVASAAISPSAERKEQFAGLEFIQKMKELSVKVNLTGIVETMTGIKDVVLNKRVIRIAVNTNSPMEETLLTSVDGFLKTVPGEFKKSYDIFKPPIVEEEIDSNIFVETPLNYHFTAHCTRTVAYTDDDYPLLRLASSLLSTKYCAPLIKYKGTAQHASSTLSTSGVFTFFTRRDRHPSSSFDIFEGARKWLETGDNYSTNDVEEAKLNVFQFIDSPIPPGSRGIRNFLFGISDDQLQKQRLAVKTARKEDLIRVARRLDGKCRARCLVGPSANEVSSKFGGNWVTRFTD